MIGASFPAILADSAQRPARFTKVMADQLSLTVPAVRVAPRRPPLALRLSGTAL